MPVGWNIERGDEKLPDVFGHCLDIPEPSFLKNLFDHFMRFEAMSVQIFQKKRIRFKEDLLPKYVGSFIGQGE